MVEAAKHPKYGVEWRLRQLEHDREKIVIRLTIRRAAITDPDEDKDRASLAIIDGLIRAERIRIGMEEFETTEICWNKLAFHSVLAWLAIWLIVGIIALMFGGWQ